MKVRPADVSRFTEGDCHIFARHMATVTGYPLAVFLDECEFPDLHAFVVTPDGPIDILGLHAWDDFFVLWRSRRWRTITWAELERDWGGWTISRWSVERARQLVPVVLKSAGIHS